MNPSSGRRLLVVLLLGSVWSCGEPEAADFVVTATYPHDEAAYTQGLLTVNGQLYESTGIYGYSDLRRVRLETGVVEARHSLDSSRFAEGLAHHDGRLYQLTWREGIGYVYQLDTFAPVDSFKYAGEGWGLASDGANLFFSDGSDSIRVLNPRTFAVERILKVTHDNLPLTQLNELEFFEGKLLANIYTTSRVAMIDPATGVVTRLLDFLPLYRERTRNAEAMNGIAVTADGKELLLTGKRWPIVFQVRLKPAL